MPATRSEGLAQHQPGRQRAEQRHQKPERAPPLRPGGFLKKAPEASAADQRGEQGEIGHRAGADQPHAGHAGDDGRPSLEDEREREQRDRRHRLQPDHHREHVDLAGARIKALPRAQLAAEAMVRPRPTTVKSPPTVVAIVQKPERCDTSSGELARLRPLAQSKRREQDGQKARLCRSPRQGPGACRASSPERKANWPTKTASCPRRSSASAARSAAREDDRQGGDDEAERGEEKRRHGAKPRRITTKLKPQIAVTRTARAMWRMGMGERLRRRAEPSGATARTNGKSQALATARRPST